MSADVPRTLPPPDAQHAGDSVQARHRQKSVRLYHLSALVRFRFPVSCVSSGLGGRDFPKSGAVFAWMKPG
jgi:hypothetical protein